MNGLMQQGAPAQEQAPQKGNPAAGYKALMDQLGEFIYAEQTIAMISKTFKQTGDVSQAIPVIVARIFQTIIEQANGKPMPPDMLAMAMTEITGAVMEMAVAAGLLQEGDASNAGPEMFMESARNLDKNMGDKMAPEQRQGLGQVFSKIAGGMQ